MKPTLILLPLLPLLSHAALLERFEYGGHTYDIYGDTRTWTAANSDAATRSVSGATGHLWRVDGSAENTFVFNKIMTYTASFTSTASDGGGARYVWLGASDAAVEGTWRWSDGTQFWSGAGLAGGGGGASSGGLYNNWGGLSSFSQAVEPDDYMGAQDAAGIALDDWAGYGVAGEWNDIGGSNTMGYVVEYDAVAAVPEPAEWASVAGAAGLALAWRRRRKSA